MGDVYFKVSIKEKGLLKCFKEDFFGFKFFYVRYSSLLRLPPLRFLCFGGLLGIEFGTVATLALTAKRSNHSARSRQGKSKGGTGQFFFLHT
jgi:hypothetical protein